MSAVKKRHGAVVLVAALLGAATVVGTLSYSAADEPEPLPDGFYQEGNSAPKLDRHPGEDSATPLPGPAARAVTNGFILDDIRVGALGDPIPGHVRIWYRIDWAGDAFPGSRECMWFLLDAAGNEIAHEHRRAVALAPSSAADEASYLDIPVATTERPASATVECAASRTDNPSGGYQITNVAS